MGHLFLSYNLIDDADLSLLVGTAKVNYPLSNIKNYFTTKKFRAEASTVSMLIDTKVITPKTIIMLVGSSVDGLGFSSVSMYSSTTTDFTGAVEQPVTVSSLYNIAYLRFTSVNNRYFKLVFTGDSSVEVSNIYLGEESTITDKSFAQDSFRYIETDRSITQRNSFGNKFVDQGSRLLSIVGSFKVLQEADRDTLDDLIARHGVHTPFYIILDPDNALGTDSNFKLSGIFYFESIPEISSITSKYFQSSVSLLQGG